MIDRKIKYIKLHMKKIALDRMAKPQLPSGFTFDMYQENNKSEWIKIQEEIGEVNAKDSFLRYYGNGERELVNKCIFIVDSIGCHVGTATANHFHTQEEIVGDLQWVAIRPKYQRLGLSKALILKAENVMKTKGCSTAILSTQTQTYVACKVYLDLGWEPDIQQCQEIEGWKIVQSLINHPKLSMLASIK